MLGHTNATERERTRTESWRRVVEGKAGKIRAGVFFVDLPNQTEREAIWRIQITKFKRDPQEFDVVQLARATEGLTGSEIEQLFIDSLHEAFSRHVEPTDLSIALLLNDLVPLSKLMSEQIDGLRRWARGRARLATPQPSHSQGRKIAT